MPAAKKRKKSKRKAHTGHQALTYSAALIGGYLLLTNAKGADTVAGAGTGAARGFVRTLQGR